MLGPSAPSRHHTKVHANEFVQNGRREQKKEKFGLEIEKSIASRRPASVDEATPTL